MFLSFLIVFCELLDVDLACLSLLVRPAREVPICVLMVYNYTMYRVYVQGPENKCIYKLSHNIVQVGAKVAEWFY